MHAVLAIAANLAVFFGIVFWLGLAFWVLRDARRRVSDPWLIGIATVVGLVIPYLGAVAYLLFRPPETLEEAHAREVEVRALEQRFGVHAEHCPVCFAETEPGYLVCPVCTTRLRNPCRQCEAPLDPLWQVCPYCATPAAPSLETVVEDLDVPRRRRTSGSRPAAS